MTQATATQAETIEAVKEAGLRYYDDRKPGWTRVPHNGTGAFDYVDADGKKITDAEQIDRANKIVIPPAWTHVWIAPYRTAHLQAVGRDAKGRKQYRYHEKFRSHRDETKYGRLADFGKTLPTIRAKVEADLSRRCTSREHILALVLRLLDRTHIRVGNEVYAKENAHYGLTTLRRKHVDIVGDEITFHFTGKSGKDHEIKLHDLKLARAMEKCYDLPGHELFKYLGEAGEKHKVDSQEVNDYIREITGGGDFTAKDFRTWAGTVIAAVVLTTLPDPIEPKECKDNLLAAIKTTAGELGNTPATCRKYYIHPVIFEAYEDRSLRPAMEQSMQAIGDDAEKHRLTPEEAAVLAILEGARKNV